MRILVGKAEGNTRLRTLRLRWEYNIKVGLKGGRGLNLCGSKYETMSGFYEHDNEPFKFHKVAFLTGCYPVDVFRKDAVP